MGVFMRLATFVFGIGFAVMGGNSQASEPAPTSSFKVAHTGSIGESVFVPRTERVSPYGSARPNIGDSNLTAGGVHAMGLLPAQTSGSFTGVLPFDGSNVVSPRPYHPANIPLPALRTVEDHLLTGFVALMLIAYQLRRKHRFLRPHQFST
jgi:hypothetical protein